MLKVPNKLFIVKSKAKRVKNVMQTWENRKPTASNNFNECTQNSELCSFHTTLQTFIVLIMTAGRRSTI